VLGRGVNLAVPVVGSVSKKSYLLSEFVINDPNCASNLTGLKHIFSKIIQREQISA